LKLGAAPTSRRGFLKTSVFENSPILEWVDKRRRLTLHFTPTYASWLNQVEIWFNIFTRDVVKGGVWRSTQQALVKQIIKYIRQYNEERTHPFRCTYEGKPLQA
jgi:putative transposase